MPHKHYNIGENNPNFGKHHSEETKLKISNAEKGKIISLETREKMSQSQKGIPTNRKPMLGKHHTEETKQKMREKRKGRKPNLGHKHTEETKQKMREKRKGRKPNLGHKHTEETKLKIGIACSNPPEERRKRWSLKRRKENNPNWRGGITEIKYCPKWTEKLREEIRERDNQICQLCGKTKEKNNKRLSVHHVHYDKENCYPDLITLCNSCNNKVNFNRLYWEYMFMSMLTKRKLLNYFGDIINANQ